MSWNDWSYRKKIGLIFGSLAVILFLILYLRMFIETYISCSRDNWIGMCGTEIAIIGWTYGLGLSLLPLIPFTLIVEVFLRLGIVSKNPGIIFYSLMVLALTIGVFITYFLIGYLIGWIFDKFKGNKPINNPQFQQTQI